MKDKIEVIFDKFSSFIVSIGYKITLNERLKALEIGKLINDLRIDKDWDKKLTNNPFEDFKALERMDEVLSGKFPIHPNLYNKLFGDNYAERKNYINKRTNRRRLRKWWKYIQRTGRIFRRRRRCI